MPTSNASDLQALLADAGVRLHRNLSVPGLVEEALRRGEAALSSTGALRATTGRYTGRSPKDKFLVVDDGTHGRVDWGKTNQPLPPDEFDAPAREMASFAAGRDMFVFDGFGGADPAYRLPIRIITQYA